MKEDMKRKIIQITAAAAGENEFVEVFALADDGTFWNGTYQPDPKKAHGSKWTFQWTREPELPQE